MVRLAFHSHWPELIAAGMMILAGGGRGLPLDYDELERWTRSGLSGVRDHAMASGEPAQRSDSGHRPNSLTASTKLTLCMWRRLAACPLPIQTA